MTSRTDYCGALRASDAGRTVTVCGWVARRREHGEHLAFIDVRDHSGVVQCVVDGAHDLRNEYVVMVTGTVRARPEGTVNPQLPTGEVELGDCRVDVLNAAEPPPFPLDDRVEADETVRLRYRYLDLRRDRMQKNLRLRSKINAAVRNAMLEQDFVEIETPMLIASTPEGARDFVVPARLQQGSFYVLPQSPQLFKQLCMVGGLDRYFQLARCLRDEDLRADRQFEFIQLDAEMAFASQDDVMAAISRAITAAAAAAGFPEPEIGRITWLDAAERFGSDKPDLRFGLELVELTEVFVATGFNAFKAACVKGIRVPGGADYTRSRLDDLTEKAKQWGAKGLVWMRVTETGLDSPVAKFLSDDESAGLRTALAAEAGDLLLIVADDRRPRVRHVLGLLRLEIGRPPVTEGGLHFTWIVDFPLFEDIDDDGRPVAAHHLFTMPHPDDIERLTTDPLAVRAQSYDLVLNGWELGSGSVRIHDAAVQQLVFDAVGIDAEDAQRRFGFLLDAFRFGAPPHAGFAFGMDRLVALLAGEENIREIIAFPKTQSGLDLLTGAPTPIEPAALEELGLRVLPRKD